jgi:hypothetical protein
MRTAELTSSRNPFARVIEEKRKPAEALASILPLSVSRYESRRTKAQIEYARKN